MAPSLLPTISMGSTRRALKRRYSRRPPPPTERSSFFLPAAAKPRGQRAAFLLGRGAEGFALFGHLEEAADRFRRDRPAEQPALRFRTAVFGKRVADLLGLDAL